MILALSSTMGCIQSGKEAFPEEKAPEKGSGGGSVTDALAAPHLEIDFQSEVEVDRFYTWGTLFLRSNGSLPYLMLNATLLREGRPLESTKYLMIDVDPGREYGFEISESGRMPAGDYRCLLEVSGPKGLIASETRQCLIARELSSRGAGQSLREPKQSIKNPGQSLREPEQSIKNPGQSLKEPGQSPKNPGQSLEEPGQSLKQSERALREPGPNPKEPEMKAPENKSEDKGQGPFGKGDEVAQVGLLASGSGGGGTGEDAGDEVATSGDTKMDQRDRNDGQREDLATAGASPGIYGPEPSQGAALTRSEQGRSDQGRSEQGDPTAEKVVERGAINAGPASTPGSPAAGAVSLGVLPSVYVGSKSSDKYHRPECRYATKIQKENRFEFASSEEAERQGYLPCKVCNP